MNEKASLVNLAGVIGSPIQHSLSPTLHSYWLKSYNINGYYIPLHVQEHDIESALRLLPRMGFCGLNVTHPHKETILSFVDQITDEAAFIGAANTLSFSPDGKIHADNTDGYGFLQNVTEKAPHWKACSGPVLVIGAGGASRSIISALIGCGVPEIYVANRTLARAEKLRENFGSRINPIDLNSVQTVLPMINLAVNTTSLGMTDQPPLDIDLSKINPDCTVTDIVYNPLKTRFLQNAADMGCHIVDGLGMLLHQAAPGFERWYGIKPKVDEELRRAVLSL